MSINNSRFGDKSPCRAGYVQLSVIEDYPDLSEYYLHGSGPPVMVYAWSG